MDPNDVLLSRCFSDVTARLARGEGRKAYGRQSEVAELLALLASPLPRHPVLLGRSGVGKSAVALEVADAVRRGDCPEPLRGLRVLATSPRQLLGGLPPGDGWRAALPSLWEALHAGGPTLLLFANAQDAAGAGIRAPYETDLAGVLAELLQTPTSGGGLRLLAEARSDRWGHLATTKAAFTSLFVPVWLREPTGDALHAVLDAACADLEIEHGVAVAPAARERAVELTGRYVVNAAQPGKALALLEETMAAHAGDGGRAPEVGSREVMQRFATRTGLPLRLLDEAELWDEREVRAHFQRHVLGQELALEAVVQRLSLLKAGIHDPNRPLGVFFFIGPTGVGKTELAKALATFMFGRADRLVRVNMADYTEPWQFTQLFGDPDPEEPIEVQRGQLTTRLGDQTFTILLLDEFEKAYPNIFQRFLQLFDEGVLVNGAGEEIPLRNAVIILTSNFAANMARGEWGFAGTPSAETMEQRVLRTAEEFFTPEFINRIDQVVFFHPLNRDTVRRIAFRELESLFQREGILRRRVQVEVDDSVVDWVLERGYSERFGARFLRRQIEKSISYPIARALVSQPIEPGSLLRVAVRGGPPGQIAAVVVPPAEATSLDGEPQPPAPGQGPLGLAEVRQALPALRARVEQAATVHHLDALRAQRDESLAAMSRPDFWDDPEASQRHMQQLGATSARVELLDGLLRALDEADFLLGRIWGSADRGQSAALVRLYRRLLADLERAELDLSFRDALDPLDAWLSVAAGGDEGEAGGWVAEIVGMYLGWAARRGWEATVVDEGLGAGGRDALIRARLRIAGHGAFALLRGESGIHRLAEGEGGRTVRQARVAVWPQVEADAVPLTPSDLAMQGGPTSGRGRFLKRLRSRVALSHRPSGLSIECASDAPLHETEALALALLRGALARQRADADAPPMADDGSPWGDVVRTYQRHREQGVRDLRTGTVVRSVRHVLAGRLDPFLLAALARRAQTGAR